MLFSYGFEQQFKIYFDWFTPLRVISYGVFFFMVIGKTPGKYCLMIIFSRVLFKSGGRFKVPGSFL